MTWDAPKIMRQKDIHSRHLAQLMKQEVSANKGMFIPPASLFYLSLQQHGLPPWWRGPGVCLEASVMQEAGNNVVGIVLPQL